MKPYRIENNFLVLEDDNTGMSLTNCIEDVVSNIKTLENLTDSINIIYKDSEGVWDAVIIKEDKVSFIHLGASNKEEAKEKYLNKLS